jgi:hypothetical protein
MSGRDCGGAVQVVEESICHYLAPLGCNLRCTQSAFALPSLNASLHPYQLIWPHQVVEALLHYWLLDVRSETRLLDDSIVTN